ncbi:MAG: hypothetical protein QM655_13725 [Nocardioidaceae bacterium]
MDTLAKPVTRKSLPLTERDLADIERLRTSQAHQAAIASLAEVSVADNTSDASILHALLEIGLRAVRERVELEGYELMAQDQDAAKRQASARRRRPSWSDDK